MGGTGGKIFWPAEAVAEDRAQKSKPRTPALASERRAVIQDNVQLPRVYMAWLTSPIYKPGDAEADLGATILGGGKSSRLYKKLVYENRA